MPLYGDTNTTRPDYAPKRSAKEAIAAILATQGVDAADAVTVLGIYGERGVVFYPNQDDDTDPDAKVAFSLVAKNANPCDNNLSREHAKALVRFLIEQYGFGVRTERVPVTTYVDRAIVD